jgi:hypothetical protein
MSELSLYWRGWPEHQLASFQQDQGKTNHCAKYAAASALNMLYGTSLSGDDLIAWLESKSLRGTGKYSILGNHNGSLVYQTANLIRKLAGQNGLNPIVRCGFGTKADLRHRLWDGNSLTLISVTYFQGKEPVIARGTSIKTSLGSTRLIGGHLMVLGAYHPGHSNEAGMSTPWGFLSSWPSQGNLFWMTEVDFFRTWGSLSYFNIITVQRSPGIKGTA